MSSQESAFETLLQESIVEGLDALGRDMSKTVLYFVCLNKGIEINEVCSHVELFISGLKDFFGEGSAAIEYLILERLNSKIRLIPSFRGELSLLDYIKLYEEVNQTGKKVWEI
ncbi:MAG: hypothetical protein HYU39_08960 [Thaumarchaeota archaeon]|nr:hypothetical protein [Nitrososphaerota archaeon]